MVGCLTRVCLVVDCVFWRGCALVCVSQYVRRPVRFVRLHIILSDDFWARMSLVSVFGRTYIVGMGGTYGGGFRGVGL